LKNARIVGSVRGPKGGYQLLRPPSQIRISEVIRLIYGQLALFGDADQLPTMIGMDTDHRALYQVFLDVRDGAARILENTSLADIVKDPEFPRPKFSTRYPKTKQHRREALGGTYPRFCLRALGGS
jgi:DNA-binding IscR family transcriptional regulator